MANSASSETGEDDIKAPIIIAVMGMTGSGKSTFIQKASGLPNIDIGHALESCTVAPQPYRFTHDSKELILIDTPGFDDTFRDDAEILQEVATFLEATYNQNIKLSGIVYLHDITKNRMAHGATANLAMFRALCGEKPLGSVILATTRWGILRKESHDIAVDFENQLKTNEKYWGGMIKHGSRVSRFQNSRESAMEILRPLIEKNTEITLQIQQEMAVEGRKVASTSAGAQLNQELLALDQKLQQQLLNHEKAIEKAKLRNDKEMEDFKTNEARKTQTMLRKIQDQESKLHEDRRDEVRQFDMKMNQLRKMHVDHEREAIQRLESEIERLKTAMQADRKDRKQAEIMIKEKQVAKTKKEKWLAVLSATGTTAAAAGLSVINPLAIPVAINGVLGIISALWPSKGNADGTNNVQSSITQNLPISN